MCLKKSMLGCCFFVAHTCAMESKKSEEIKPVPLTKQSSIYLQYIRNGSTDFNKGNIHKVFSTYSEKYGGNCNIFNLLSKFAIDQDAASMKIVLEVYAERNRAMKELVECSSDAYGTTIMHHLMEHIKKESFIPFLECMIIILNKHPQIIQATDKNSRCPLWFFKQNKCFKDNDIEATVINMVEKAYYDKNADRSHILSQCRLLYFIAKQDLKSIHNELRYYNNKEDGFLAHRFCLGDQEKTLAHFAIDQMNEKNFEACYAILQFLLKKQPNLDVKWDVERYGKTPLEYLNVLLTENPNLITQEQFKKVAALLNGDPGSVSLFSCFACFAKK